VLQYIDGAIIADTAVAVNVHMKLVPANNTFIWKLLVSLTFSRMPINIWYFQIQWVSEKFAVSCSSTGVG